MGSFPVHERTPPITEDRANPVRDRTVGPVGRSLNPFVQAHGIFMTIAWPILAVTGIFFAAWMKPALPNGEWFQASPPSTLKTVCLHALMDSFSLSGSLPPLSLLPTLPFSPPFPLSPFSLSTTLLSFPPSPP